jgi:integrase
MKPVHAPKPSLRPGRPSPWRCDGIGEVSPGRTLRFTASGRTQAEAKSAWVKKVEVARSGVVTDKISAAAYFDQWLKKKRGQVLKTTADRYKIVINNHLYRHFNGLLLADIRRSDIESLVALANGTVRAATIRHMVATISSILSSAVDDGIIPRNPAQRIAVARDLNPRPDTIVSPPDMLALLERQEPSQTCELLKFLTVVPLRLNEARGLKLADFSENFSVVSLTEAATRDMRPERRVLKTMSSRRTITLPPPARAIVLRAFQRHQDERLPSTWLFDQGDGNPPSEGQLHHYFARLKKHNGWLPARMRIHDLRGGMATHLDKLGESVTTIQRALGHSDPVTTLRNYMRSDSKQVTTAFDKVWATWSPEHGPAAPTEELPPKSPPNATNGVDEESVPSLGKVAFRAGSNGGERGIRTLDGVAPKPHFQCGAIDH